MIRIQIKLVACIFDIDLQTIIDGRHSAGCLGHGGRKATVPDLTGPRPHRACSLSGDSEQELDASQPRPLPKLRSVIWAKLQDREEPRSTATRVS